MARIWKARSGSKSDEKALVLYENEIWGKKNNSHTRFVYIGLENVAAAAARVVGGPSRCSNKEGQKRRCI